MIEFISLVEHTAVGEIVKAIISGGLAWAKNRKKPKPEAVEQKLSDLAAKAIPSDINPADRESVINSLVEIAKPTFDEIVQYSPNTQKIMMVAKKAVVKKAVAKKAVNGKAFRKAAPVKHAVKKSVAVKKVAKKIVAKKAPAKKMARRR